MVAVTSRIPIGENERLAITIPLVLEALGIIVDFIEQGNKMHGMALGATTTVVVSITGVGDMGLVVFGIHVFAIPTRGELWSCQFLGKHTCDGKAHRDLDADLITLLVRQVLRIRST